MIYLSGNYHDENLAVKNARKGGLIKTNEVGFAEELEREFARVNGANPVGENARHYFHEAGQAKDDELIYKALEVTRWYLL